jgi:hypothetical protein
VIPGTRKRKSSRKFRLPRLLYSLEITRNDAKNRRARESNSTGSSSKNDIHSNLETLESTHRGEVARASRSSRAGSPAPRCKTGVTRPLASFSRGRSRQTAFFANRIGLVGPDLRAGRITLRWRTTGLSSANIDFPYDDCFAVYLRSYDTPEVCNELVVVALAN